MKITWQIKPHDLEIDIGQLADCETAEDLLDTVYEALDGDMQAAIENLAMDLLTPESEILAAWQEARQKKVDE